MLVSETCSASVNTYTTGCITDYLDYGGINTGAEEPLEEKIPGNFPIIKIPKKKHFSQTDRKKIILFLFIKLLLRFTNILKRRSSVVKTCILKKQYR